VLDRRYKLAPRAERIELQRTFMDHLRLTVYFFGGDPPMQFDGTLDDLKAVEEKLIAEGILVLPLIGASSEK
jgi:pyruvate-formate lyase-activating enzyme